MIQGLRDAKCVQARYRARVMGVCSRGFCVVLLPNKFGQECSSTRQSGKVAAYFRMSCYGDGSARTDTRNQRHPSRSYILLSFFVHLSFSEASLFCEEPAASSWLAAQSSHGSQLYSANSFLSPLNVIDVLLFTVAWPWGVPVSSDQAAEIGLVAISHHCVLGGPLRRLVTATWTSQHQNPSWTPYLSVCVL